MIQHEFEELLEQFSQDELNEKRGVACRSSFLFDAQAAFVQNT